MYNLTNKQHNYIRHRLLTTVGDGWGKVTVEWRRQLLCCLFQKVNKVVSCSNLKRVVYLSQRGTELSLCVGILTSSQRDWGRKLDLESEGTRSPLILLPTKSILSPPLFFSFVISHFTTPFFLLWLKTVCWVSVRAPWTPSSTWTPSTSDSCFCCCHWALWSCCPRYILRYVQCVVNCSLFAPACCQHLVGFHIDQWQTAPSGLYET